MNLWSPRSIYFNRSFSRSKIYSLRNVSGNLELLSCKIIQNRWESLSRRNPSPDSWKQPPMSSKSKGDQDGKEEDRGRHRSLASMFKLKKKYNKSGAVVLNHPAASSQSVSTPSMSGYFQRMINQSRLLFPQPIRSPMSLVMPQLSPNICLTSLLTYREMRNCLLLGLSTRGRRLLRASVSRNALIIYTNFGTRLTAAWRSRKRVFIKITKNLYARRRRHLSTQQTHFF